MAMILQYHFAQGSRILITLLLLMGLGMTANAQPRSVIFNNEYYLQTPLADSAQIISLLTKAGSLREVDLNLAMHIADSALMLSRASNFIYGIGNSYITFAAIEETSGNYPACDSFLKIAYPFCILSTQISKTNALLVLWLQNKGNLCAYTGNYKQSISYALQALELLKQKASDSTLTDLEVTLYNDLGSMLQYLNQPDKAIQYLQKGLEIAKNNKLEKKTASLYVNFANAYRQKDDWAKWRQYLYQALEETNKYKNKFVEQVAYLSLARGYLFRQHPDSALYWLDKASKQTGNVTPYMSQSMAYVSIGNYYLEKGEFTKAILVGHEVIQQGELLGTKEVLAQAYQLLSQAYAGTENWEKAYLYRDQFSQLNDSLINAKNLLDINQLEVKYRVADKNRLIAQQALNINRQKLAIKEKNFWLVTIGATILALLIIIFLIITAYNRKRKILEGESKLARMNALMDGELTERKRLAQELHDGIAGQLLATKLRLGESINEITNHSTRNYIQLSIDMLAQAMDDLRITSQNLSNAVFEKLGFENAVSDYCKKIDQTGIIHVVYQTYGSAPTSNSLFLFSAFRIIQELIQNVLKHAQAKNLLVQLNFRNNSVAITVQDDGIGLPPEYESKNGQGLKNLKNRVIAMNGNIDISTDQSGTCFYIEFDTID